MVWNLTLIICMLFFLRWIVVQYCHYFISHFSALEKLIFFNAKYVALDLRKLKITTRTHWKEVFFPIWLFVQIVQFYLHVVRCENVQYQTKISKIWAFCNEVIWVVWGWVPNLPQIAWTYQVTFTWSLPVDWSLQVGEGIKFREWVLMQLISWCDESRVTAVVILKSTYSL